MTPAGPPFYTVQGIRVPALFYGTAWKEARTRELTRQALVSGFRAIDTANQRKHYVEAAAGEAVAAAVRERRVTRPELFLQTKFTYARGQDQRLPYDPHAPVGRQVEQSFQSSLEHLGVSTIDAYLLHGPSHRAGLSAADREVWRAMEALQQGGGVRLLGVSNVTLEQLSAFYREATVKPAFVQNRCYASEGWDSEVRAFCRDQGLLYQGFSLLTANQRELQRPAVKKIVARSGRTLPEVVFRFALALGMIVLTGTSSPEHMRLDLAAGDLGLEPAELRALESIAP